MYAMRSTAGAAAVEVGPMVTHLLDGRPVRIPYLTVGHHRADGPAASPTVTRLVSVGEELPPHPYTGEPMVLVEDSTGRMLLVGVVRLAHADGCDSCAVRWAHLDRLLELMPAGTPLYELLPTPVFTVHGPAVLVIDASDAEPGSRASLDANDVEGDSSSVSADVGGSETAAGAVEYSTALMHTWRCRVCGEYGVFPLLTHEEARAEASVHDCAGNVRERLELKEQARWGCAVGPACTPDRPGGTVDGFATCTGCGNDLWGGQPAHPDGTTSANGDAK